MNRIEIPLAGRTDLKARYQEREPLYHRTLENVRERIRQTLENGQLHPTIKARVKSFDSLYAKVLARVRSTGADTESQPDAATEAEGPGVVRVPDLFGVRVVCAFLGDLTHVEKLLSEMYEVIEVERKGTEFSSREFGYESTHLLVRIPESDLAAADVDVEAVCEIQLRTILQDAWAEVEHELVYKAENAPFEEHLKRKLAALNANLTLADLIFQEVRDYHRSLHHELSKRRRQFWSQIQHASGLPFDRGEEDSEVTHIERLNAPDLMDPARLSTVADATEAQLLNALHAHNRRDFERAVELYTEILKTEDKAHLQAIVSIHRGMAYFALSDYSRAIEDFSRTLSLDDDNWKAYYYRGMVHRLQGDYRRALSDLNRCLELEVGEFDSLFARAQVYFDIGDYQKALSDCDAALEAEPDSAELRRFRKLVEARLLSESGNWSG
ncbi:MAG: tetratricopeptide repeat protein [Spirochaetota bacterium]